MTFDLKGSLYGRKEKFKDQDTNWWQKNKLGHRRIMKEKNYLEINKDWNRSLINLSDEQVDSLNQVIINDS
jgi:hypothetical protein